jgi:transcriptional regulator with XRE-family HTH domain
MDAEKKRRAGRPAIEQSATVGPFARNLRRLREAVGMSQAELAEKAGVHIRALSNYESGRVPNLHKARDIAKALGADLAAMLEEALPEQEEDTT